MKPLGLMRWLVRLLVPGPDGNGEVGCVLDPFAGSGATLEAARLEGRRAVGVERDEHSCRLIAARLGVESRIAAPAAPDDLTDAEVAALDATEGDPYVGALEAIGATADPEPEPTPTETLLGKAAVAESVDALRELARGAVSDGLWTEDVRAAFTARKTALLEEAAA